MKHEDILAKSINNGGENLYSHLYNTMITCISMAKSQNKYLNKKLSIQKSKYIGGFHDIGKASPEFQIRLDNKFDYSDALPFRHEIASMFFLSLVPKSYRENFVEGIIGHHKSVETIGICENKYGIIDLVDYYGLKKTFDLHIGKDHKWLNDATDILNSLGFKTKPITKEIAYDNFIEAYNITLKLSKINGASMYRGLLMSSDHYTSAIDINNTSVNIFKKPNISFYDRKSELYPLSMKKSVSRKKHTLVISSTGSGKTDFLMRRCKGRIYYTLPFQASLNAMYDRFKNDMPIDDVRILHGASKFVVKDNRESIVLQKLVGSSVKVLTPYQLMGLSFCSKGYESILFDIAGCDIIMDEIHTYSESIKPYLANIISILVDYGCRIHIGTATIPTELYNQILEILGGKDKVYEVSLTDKEKESFNRHIIHKLDYLNSDKTNKVIDDCVSSNKKLLLCFNTVKKARNFYIKIKEKYPEVESMIIHSKYRRKDRIELEKLLLNKFNAMNDKPCIVVSTQVIEVSINIDFDCMITECAPIDSLVQRFGRINRKRTNIGYRDIFILKPENKVLIYDDTIVRNTFNVFKDGELLEEKNIQKMIDDVYQDFDFNFVLKKFALYSNHQYNIGLDKNTNKMEMFNALEIDSRCVILDTDVDEYIKGNSTIKSELEIPVSEKFIKYKNLIGTSINYGNHPCIISSNSYDGLKENYIGFGLNDELNNISYQIL